MFDICTGVHYDSYMSVRLPIVEAACAAYASLNLSLFITLHYSLHNIQPLGKTVCYLMLRCWCAVNLSVITYIFYSFIVIFNVLLQFRQ